MKPLNQKGISILETLIATGIMAILMVGFSSMLLNQQKETKSVAEVLAGLDLQKTLITVLSEGSVCSHILNNPVSASFNSNNLPDTITPTLPIYASVVSGTPGVVVAAVGQKASVYSSSMIIKSIRLDIVSGSGSTYTGNWIVEFDETKSVRPHKPITISAILNVDASVPGNSKIVGCMGSGSGGGSSTLNKIAKEFVDRFGYWATNNDFVEVKSFGIKCSYYSDQVYPPYDSCSPGYTEQARRMVTNACTYKDQAPLFGGYKTYTTTSRLSQISCIIN